MGGGIGGAISGIMGGDDDFHADTPKIDLNKYGYNGRFGYDYEQQGDNAQGRTSAKINYQNADQSRGLGMATRGNQAEALDMARQAALGNAPSVAQQQLLQGRDQSIQNAMAMANSVRGGGANLAAAQMGAQRQAGETMGQVNQQSAMLRANEMAQARAQYGGMAQAQRAQDLQAQGLDAGQAQAQAQLEQQQHALNDQYGLGLYGLGQHAADSSQMGGIKGQEDTSNAQLGAAGINAGIAEGQANRDAQAGAGAVQMGAEAAGGMMLMSDARLKSGIHPLTAGLHPMSQSAPRIPLQGPAPMTPMGPQPPNVVGHTGVLLSDQNLKFGIAPAGSTDYRNAAFAPGGVPQTPDQMALTDLMSNSANAAPPMGVGPNTSRDVGNIHLLSENQAKQRVLANDLHGGVDKDAGTHARSAAFGSGSGGSVSQSLGNAGQSLGAGMASLFSDARLKSGTQGASNPVDSFLGTLRPVDYHYKAGVPGEDPHAERYGILAQDVARSPMGRSLVEQTPVGMGINIPHATGALLAGEGELYARQRRLEDQLRTMRGR